MARELKVVLTGDNRDLARMFKSADKDASAFERRMSSMSSRTKSAFGAVAKGAGLAGAAIGVGLVVEAKRAFSAFEESNKIARQTGAVLKSTGGIAKVTANDVAGLASALSKKTGVDDEAIQSGENLLLTFTNVRNEAGKGNDIFSQSTKVLTDMSIALGQDTKSSAIQLGKALNDPIKGVTALQRVGVSFTADQKEQIKTLVDSGKTLDAQKLILRELTKEFGGSAAAQATSTDKMKVAVGNLEEAFGRGLAPAVNSVADQITKFAIKAEPTLQRIGTRIGDIFNRKDLDLAGKIKLSEGVLKRNLKPLTDEIGAALKDAHLGDKLANAVEKAAPKIADAAAAAAPRAAGAFVRAFQGAGPWGKLITVAFLANKLGAFSGAGRLAADRLIGGLRANTTKTAVGRAIGPGTSAAATAQGAVSGKAYSTSFASSSATAMPGAFGKQKGKFTRASRVLGGVMGLATAAAFAVAFKPEIEDVFNDFTAEAKRRLRDFGDLGGDVIDGLLGNTDKNPEGFGRGGRAGAGDSTPLTPNPIAPLPKPSREGNRGTGGSSRPGQRHGGRASSARVTARLSSARPVAHASSTYSQAQLAQLWVRVGGNPAASDIASAVAMAESGGNSGAINASNSDGSIDRGLWQINSVHGALSTTDPMGNARAAVRISGNGTNWSPWVVYQTGAYRQYLGGSGNAGSRGGGGGGGAPASGPSVRGRGTPQPTTSPMSDAVRFRESQSSVSDRAGATLRNSAKRAAGRRARRSVGRNGLPKPGGPAKGVERDPQTMADVLAAMPTALDFLDRDAAMAALTEGTQDDIDAAQAIKAYWEQRLRDARATADPRDDIEAAGGLKGAIDALKALTDEVADQKRATEEHTAALQAVKDETKRANDLSVQYSTSGEFQVRKLLAEVMSGQFGRGIVGRGFTAGNSTEYAY